MMYSKRNRIVAGSKLLALGVLLAALTAAMLLANPAHASATFTVNSTADDGDLTPGNGECYTGVDVAAGVKACTLRAAIQEANAFSGADAIEFDIPGTDVKTITPATELPRITRPVTINGYSQPGAEPNTKAVGSDAILKIELSGASCPNCHGLLIGGANSTVKGLVVNRFGEGIRIVGPGATGNKVLGNYLGTDALGTQDLGNGDNGVVIDDSSNNTVGGTTPGARNVISGNGVLGVGIGGVDATGNKVVGNYIGTDKTGTKDLGNSLYGVNIEDAPNNTIGGASAAARNVISGNDYHGVNIYDPGATGNKVTGNYIGTDASGTKDLGNSLDGVLITGAPKNYIGGTTAGERNVISGNDSEGVRISGADAAGNKVTGNFVGTDRSGTKDLGNGTPLGSGGSGILIADAPNNTIGGTQAGTQNVISANDIFGVRIQGADATGNKVIGNFLGTDKTGTTPLGNYYGVAIEGAPNNTVGGTQAGARNIISGNGEDGVRVFGDTATANRILSNSIFANGGLGIDLGADGPTLNDTGDADTGPNNLQNFPLITSAKTVSANTTIRGSLDSTRNKSFILQFFSSPTPDPSGYGEGKRFLGQKVVTTDASGKVTFTYNPPTAVLAGHAISATATGAANTSEFSRARLVVQ